MRALVIPLVVLVLSSTCVAASISAEVSGSVTPGLSFTQPLINGDFTITTLSSFPIGDGEDDWTRWTFDFTADPEFASFSTAPPLRLARLTLDLTPGDGLVASDEVSIEGLAPIRDPAFPHLPLGVTSTVEIDLLGSYSSAEILGNFSAGARTLPMLYQDDAVVSFARLDLASVPEPGAAVLALLGLILLMVRANRGSGRRLEG